MEERYFEEGNLYTKVKKYICKKIFDESYKDGDLIPPERKLSEELGVSRITVRKALKLLEEERIIERIQGSGTRIVLHYGARQGDMDIITLVASAKNEFFSLFMDAFQIKADEFDSLVLYKQKPDDMSLERCLYQIYDKHLRNVVLWLEKMDLDTHTLRKLRGLGMNIVLFDSVSGGLYADAICLDNQEAVERIYRHLREKDAKKIGYIGWDATDIGSLRIRENTFRRLVPDGVVCHISYEYHDRLQDMPEEKIQEALEAVSGCDGVIYAVGELGIFFEGNARRKNIVHKAGMVGARPGAETLGIYAVEQDFALMAARIFECLQKQNRENSGWSAANYIIKGLE